MNADEIRAIRGTVGADGMARELTVQELFSREIAAQLAELNKIIRDHSTNGTFAVTTFKE